MLYTCDLHIPNENKIFQELSKQLNEPSDLVEWLHKHQTRRQRCQCLHGGVRFRSTLGIPSLVLGK